ncbi:reverse transcriptase domain-containing protein [Tanacetum coccineum]
MQKEKEQKDKLNAVKARLIYGDESGIKIRSHEESYYSETKTPTARTQPRRRHEDRHSRSPSPHASVFKRLKKYRSPSPRPRPRKKGGVFNRLGRKEPATSAHFGSRRRSPQAKRTEVEPRRHQQNGTPSSTTSRYSESEDSEVGHWKSKSRRHSLSRTRMPSHVKTYDGSGDPEDHLKLFQSAAKTEGWAMPTWCHMFNSTLTGNARVWFNKLPKESIDSYEDLRIAFRENYLQYKADVLDVEGALECMRISGFMHGIIHPGLIKRLYERILRSMDEMYRMTTSFLQGEVAAFSHDRRKASSSWKQSEWRDKLNFKKVFKNKQRPDRKPDRFSLLTKTPKEIFALEKGKFKAPPPMVTPAEKRDPNKYCEFHSDTGHSTDECMQLRKQIDEMIKDKPLAILMIQPWERVAKPRITQSFSPETVISFPPLGEEDGTEGPMIIEAEMGGHFVHRVTIPTQCDNGQAGHKENPRRTINSTWDVKIPRRGRHGKRKDGRHRKEIRQSKKRWKTGGCWNNERGPLSQLAFSNPVMVQKHDGTWQMYVDFKDLNNACPKDCYPLPEIDWKVESLCGYPFKCFLDVYKGYHQIKMAKEDEEKTAFITSQGIFCYSKMQFGLKNDGSTYQRLVDKAIQKQIGRNLEVYVDDLVIKSRTEEEIIRDITETFKTLRQINMKLNPKKCTFGKQEGMFLGYKVSTNGLRACPDKADAVLSLPSLRCIKDVQKLNGKLASLNRFLSKLAEKSLPFFKTLKKCTKKSDFQWTQEAEAAFKQMKKLIAELPTLTAPREHEELIIYLAATKEAISAILMTDREGKQIPVYFVSRALRGLEINYTPMEKLVLVLLSASKWLKRYFQAYTIVVITDQPIKQLLSSSKMSGRMLKWKFELEGYDIQYRPRTAIKGQILVDFIVKRPEEESPDELMAEPEELPEPWTLFTNGLSCVDGSGAGLILTNPEGTEFTYAIRFRFEATNNEAEYEALIAGLRIAKQMGVKNLQAHVDSRLIANQVNSSYIAKEPGMVLVEELKEKSINEKEILDVVEEEGNTWMTPICEYLAKEILPEDKKKARGIRRKAARFGLPVEIISDNEKQFHDNPFKDWCEKLCIRQCFAFVKHPQANGLVKRANRSLGEGIKARLDERSKDWMKELPHVLWAHRTMIKSSNGETPFSLTYDTKAVIPAEIGMPTLRTTEIDLTKNNEALGMNLDLIEERREQAAIQEAKSKKKMEKYYNSKVRGTSFKPGDMVYRTNKASRAKDEGKLRPKWEGPYEVTESLRKGAYKLKDCKRNEILRTWNICNLKKCYIHEV